MPTLEARAAAMREAVRTNAAHNILRILAADAATGGPGVRRGILTRGLTAPQRKHMDEVLDDLIASGRVARTIAPAPAKPWHTKTVYRWTGTTTRATR
ncbi:hypothetical protein ABE437_18805 [Isoptericola cucumis]|uniref:hypothetical protein n=1 Tax=Isoptericola cucumis TaxID=1776856 RepID=UPI0032083727